MRKGNKALWINLTEITVGSHWSDAELRARSLRSALNFSLMYCNWSTFKKCPGAMLLFLVTAAGLSNRAGAQRQKAF